MTNHLREWREFRGLSQEELAEKVGTSNQQISYLERGKRRLTARWMERIAAQLDCEPADLFQPPPVTPPSLQDSEATPYELSPAYEDDVDEWIRRLALSKGAKNIGVFEMRSHAMDLGGVLPGDVVAFDLDAPDPATPAIVCAQIYDWKSMRAETVIRYYDPPYLIARSSDISFAKPLLVDNANVVIKGRFIVSIRFPDGD